MQFFIGLERYQNEDPFDPSLMVHFRKRIDKKTMLEINELICRSENQRLDADTENETKKPQDPQDPQDPGEPPVSSNPE